MTKTHTKTTLEERLRFEELISDLAARLVNTSIEDVDREITYGLQRIIELLGADRISLSEFSGDSASLRITHSSQGPGIEPTPGWLMEERFPWYTSTLKKGQIIILPNLLRDVPESAGLLREYIKRTGMKSNLGIPLKTGGTILGALTIGTFHHYREWPEEEVRRLALVGEIFSNVLQRQRKEEELRKALRENRELRKRLEQENIYLREELKVHHAYDEIIGRSEVMLVLLRQVEQVADSEATVLIQGETGTGKELVARAIHRHSAHKERALVEVNCAALPATLIESELFGREKGAYTGAMRQQAGRFELADKSSIFLDEIGELPLELQPKLLRVLQEGKFERLGSSSTRQVNVRVIAATNRDLEAMVEEGSFREDLYYRLKVFPIVVPPLREHPEDISLLIQAFITQLSRNRKISIERIPRKILEQLQRYSWPGNVRELRNLVEHALIVSKGETLQIQIPEEAPADIQQAFDLNNAERRHIIKVLDYSGWRIKGDGGAAELLGLNASTLRSRMKKLNIQRPKEQG